MKSLELEKARLANQMASQVSPRPSLGGATDAALSMKAKRGWAKIPLFKIAGFKKKLSYQLNHSLLWFRCVGGWCNSFSYV